MADGHLNTSQQSKDHSNKGGSRLLNNLFTLLPNAQCFHCTVPAKRPPSCITQSILGGYGSVNHSYTRAIQAGHIRSILTCNVSCLRIFASHNFTSPRSCLRNSSSITHIHQEHHHVFLRTMLPLQPVPPQSCHSCSGQLSSSYTPP